MAKTIEEINDKIKQGRVDTCPTRLIWKEVAQAMFDTLNSITLADLEEKARMAKSKEFSRALADLTCPQ